MNMTLFNKFGRLRILTLLVIVIAAIAGWTYYSRSNDALKRAIENMPNEQAQTAQHFFNIAHWETSRGLKVYFVPLPSLPIVDISLVFAAGPAFDNGHPGIAQLTTQMIGQDTALLNANQIAEQFETLGAIFSASVSNKDATAVNLRTLSQAHTLQKAIPLFTQVLSSARFHPRTFTREQATLLTMLDAQAQSPGAQASNALYAAMYGQHPYASPTLGTKESVLKLSPEMVTHFYQQHYTARNGILVLVGDLSPDMAEQIANQISLALPEGKPAASLPEVALLTEPVVKHIPFASTQTHIMVGAPALKENDPMYFPLLVGNNILGGGILVSRLFQQVREERGLAYSIGSAFSPYKERGPFVISLQTRNEEKQQALEVVDQQLALFLKEGPTTAELEEAKENISGNFMLQFDSNAAITGQVATLAFYNLPLDYYPTFIEKVNAVTRDDIINVFNLYLQTNQLATVTVGQTSTAAPHEHESSSQD